MRTTERATAAQPGSQTDRGRREEDESPSFTPAPVRLPTSESDLPRKVPKAPKPRKVEKRRRGRKG